MAAIPLPRPKKRVERAPRDYSQKLRLWFQFAFIALNLLVGAQFYAWVRAMERGAAVPVPRPDGVEGWLPIAALMNLKAWVLTGAVPEIHPAGMFLLVAFLGISLLLKKAFCSWLCPIGTLSEWLWKAGRKILRRNLAMPKWADIPLRGLKYLLFGFFAWAVARMPAEEIASFIASPYGLIADVKLLNFFRFIGTTGLAVIGILVVLSILVQNFWCRYLCPYGALLGIVSLLSPARIRRDSEACIDCAKCTKACPSRLPVGTLPEVRSAECTMCMLCTAACPVKGALEVKVAPERPLPPWAVAASIALIFAVVVAGARLSGHWHSAVPDQVYRYLIPQSGEVSHVP